MLEDAGSEDSKHNARNEMRACFIAGPMGGDDL